MSNQPKAPKAKRTSIATFGAWGATVNVFGMTLNGESVARVEWREGPSRYTRTFRGNRQDRIAQARAFAEGTAARLGGMAPTAKKRWTVGELWEAYLLAKAGDWRPKTHTLAVARWRRFAQFMDPRSYADLVQPETLDRWKAELLTQPTEREVPMARNQVAHHLQQVKAVWRHARQRRLIGENTLADYAIRSGRDYEPKQVPEYTGAEWAAILSRLDYRSALRWRAWAAVALDGLLGVRSNALLQLRWDDVDLTRRVITWPAATDKLGRQRRQPLPRDAVFALRVCRVWARRDRYEGPFVLYGSQERTRHKAWGYAALNAMLHKATEEAGVKYVPFRAMHSLRRMAAGNVLAATGDITRVGDWLGDTDVRVLRRSYLRSRPEDLAAVVAATQLPTVGESGNQMATGARRGARSGGAK
jgi:integrase